MNENESNIEFCLGLKRVVDTNSSPTRVSSIEIEGEVFLNSLSKKEFFNAIDRKSPIPATIKLFWI